MSFCTSAIPPKIQFEHKGQIVQILLVEDEIKIADIVTSGLTERGYVVTHIADGLEALTTALRSTFDLHIFDIMLPGKDGLSILQELRNAGNSTPTILLTARNQLKDRVDGLNLGADDYLAKPFFVEELDARIKAIARRISGEREYIISVGDFKLDRINRQAFANTVKIDLSSREFNLLEYLMRSPGKIFTRGQILEHVWGYDFDPSTNIVDVCVKRIRDKIASIDSESNFSIIEAVRGAGYRFRPPRGENL
nr:response regulator transcription factor [Undibacterium sp. LX40W]